MKKIKGLLYCCKAKPSLMKYENIDGYYTDTDPVLDKRALLNGTIVAECDFEVEEFDYMKAECLTHTYLDLLKNSCLTDKQMYDYLKGKNGYAIHIKNLHIFDKPRELSDFNKIIETIYGEEPDATITRAPQNMMRCCYEKKPKEWEKGVLISIQPQWMCLILNRIKDVEVRKVVLKEMLGNE